jgi:oxygen-independent coproporphyrinogen-3 oxidase
MSLGVYISVPFCRMKCTYCNFASGVYARASIDRYVERLCRDIADVEKTAGDAGGVLERRADSVYLGGGTPTILEPSHLERIFAALGQQFEIADNAEITIECAPGSLTPVILSAFTRLGVNRVSLGVQSLVDREAAAVGRQHTRAVVLDDIERLRAVGITNINVDLIAGLPHQTAQSWRQSLGDTIATGVPHVSVYMLEVDEDSRLGRELIAGGTRYHAHFVPDDDLIVDLYTEACEKMPAVPPPRDIPETLTAPPVRSVQRGDIAPAAPSHPCEPRNGGPTINSRREGIAQYEISNFARPGMASRHNLKYWTRQPYLGFGLDAHSMLEVDPYMLLGKGSAAVDDSAACMLEGVDTDAVRLATTDSLEEYLAGAPLRHSVVSNFSALEETFFLGLRLNHGVDLKTVAARFGGIAESVLPTVAELEREGLLERDGSTVRLTARGRLLSNEVFERFLLERSVVPPPRERPG